MLLTTRPKLLVLLVPIGRMGKTTVEMSESTRDELRKYKAQDGQTYDEAVTELLDNAGWFDERKRAPQWELEMILDVEDRWDVTGEEAEMFLERVGAFGPVNNWPDEGEL